MISVPFAKKGTEIDNLGGERTVMVKKVTDLGELK